MSNPTQQWDAPQSPNALGCIFPIPPQPYCDESGNSWIQRLCGVHHCNMREFKYLVGIERDNSYANFDFDTSHYVWPRITKYAGLSRTATIAGRVKLESVWHHYRGQSLFVSTPCNSAPTSNWCQLCWREDAEPYLRWQWRLKKYKRCTKHGIQMSEQCPWCQSQLFMGRALLTSCRSKRGVPSISHCGKCFMPMIDASVGFVSPGEKTYSDYCWDSWNYFFEREQRIRHQLEACHKRISREPSSSTLRTFHEKYEESKRKQEECERKARYFLGQFMTSRES